MLAFKLITEYPKKFARAVSYTSRTPRRGEIDGVHYYFLSREQMKHKEDNDEFLTVKKDLVSGDNYGTSIVEINRIVEIG